MVEGNGILSLVYSLTRNTLGFIMSESQTCPNFLIISSYKFPLSLNAENWPQGQSPDCNRSLEPAQTLTHSTCLTEWSGLLQNYWNHMGCTEGSRSVEGI